MLRQVIGLSLLLYSTFALCAGHSSNWVALNELGFFISELRAMPVGTDGNATCPSNVSSLQGFTRNEVLKALGSPDFDEAEDGGTGISYFLTPTEKPLPKDEDGIVHFRVEGTFPVVSFDFDAQGLSIASCLERYRW